MPQTRITKCLDITTNHKILIFHFSQTQARALAQPEFQPQPDSPDEPEAYQGRVYRRLKRKKQSTDLAQEVGLSMKKTKKTIHEQIFEEESQNQGYHSNNMMLIEIASEKTTPFDVRIL